MRGFYGQLFGAAFLVIARQQQAYQAHGKGTAPEAGPRHGAVGLWVTPERAAQGNAATTSAAAAAAVAAAAAGRCVRLLRAHNA